MKRKGTWDTLLLSPPKLMKMVLAGTATVVGKDRFGRKIYEVEEWRPPKKLLTR